MRKLPSLSSNHFFKEETPQLQNTVQKQISYDPKEDELKKLLDKYSEIQNSVQSVKERQDKFDEVVNELKNNVLQCLSKHVENQVVEKPREESLVCEMEKPKISRNKRTFLKMNEDLIVKLREKFPLFPKEFEDKLYTTDCNDAFVDFKNRKMEVDGATVLRLLNYIAGK